MSIYLLLLIGHLIGTVLGIGGATMIEVHLNRALKDGEMSPDERGMLGLDFTVLRIGLIISVLTGFGFLLLYKFTGQTFRLYNPVLWAKSLIVVIIAVNALLLQAHKVNLYWGSALSFVSWWSAGLLGIFLTNGIRHSFWEIMITYTIAVVVGAAILHGIRKLINRKSNKITS